MGIKLCNTDRLDHHISCWYDLQHPTCSDAPTSLQLSNWEPGNKILIEPAFKDEKLSATCFLNMLVKNSQSFSNLKLASFSSPKIMFFLNWSIVCKLKNVETKLAKGQKIWLLPEWGLWHGVQSSGLPTWISLRDHRDSLIDGSLLTRIFHGFCCSPLLSPFQSPGFQDFRSFM